MADLSYTDLHKYNQTTAALIADPEVTGDLLLIGLWLARATVLNDPPPGEGRWSLRRIAYDVFGTGSPMSVTFAGSTTSVPDHLIIKVERAIRSDRPHYDPVRDNQPGPSPWAEMPCRAPMIRRSGECGKPSTIHGYVTDLSTGREVALAACRRHKPWFDQHTRANWEAVRAAGDTAPTPAANAGGVLARHIRRVNWPALWRKVDPSWVPPPEGESTRKPSLHVFRNDEIEPCDDWSRPALVAHEGGWR